MLWEEYYGKLYDWATSTAVSRMSQLESFGPPDEIIDAILTIGIDDEKGANRLLKKATAAGVKFSGDQLADIFPSCEEEWLNKAIQFSSDQFTTQDLEALYCFCDDEILIDIARKRRIRLPEELREETTAIYHRPVKISAPKPASWKSKYRSILHALEEAHGYLIQAYKLSISDVNGGNRAITVAKYACLVEAQPYIAEALQIWESMEPMYKEKIPLQNISINIGNATMWNNYLTGSVFTNLFVRKRIYKTTRNIELAMNTLRKLLSTQSPKSSMI